MNHLKPKRIVICLALIGASTLLSSAQAALLFSQYVDGNDNKKVWKFIILIRIL